MRIVFMGTAELSRASLEALARDRQFSVAAVVTQPDKPKGRDLKLQPSPVKSLALRLNLPLLQPARARDEQFIAELRELRPDLIVVVAYGHILPPAILELPRFGCLNVHTSLLPKYRGAGPIQWAIANGETETGVTVMKMDAGLDTGPIISQRRTPILPEDDSAALHDRLAALGAELLAETVPAYVAGKIQPQPQPAEGASHAPKIKKEDGRIDWTLPARTIRNRLRAFTPWPGAFTTLTGARTVHPREAETETRGRAARAPSPCEILPTHLLKIWKAEIVEKDSGRDSALRCPDAAARRPHPGEILSADKNGIVVACGLDALRILELQREGGRRMSAAEFLAGHALTAGEKF
jgi:methionyl-tRNA formyltransferase